MAQTTGEITARPRVAMPFSCALDPASGRLRLQPAHEQIYEIADKRETQRFTTCGPAGSAGGRCRTCTVHRFTLQCGSHRLPWMNFVAAALAVRPGPKATIEDGHFTLARSVPVTG